MVFLCFTDGGQLVRVGTENLSIKYDDIRAIILGYDLVLML